MYIVITEKIQIGAVKNKNTTTTNSTQREKWR
jgi:hypothetical protein